MGFICSILMTQEELPKDLWFCATKNNRNIKGVTHVCAALKLVQCHLMKLSNALFFYFKRIKLDVFAHYNITFFLTSNKI